MKRKLLVTLVASALELYAASAGAQVATCNIATSVNKSVNGSTPVFASKLNPIDGFPEVVTDSNQQSFVRCLDLDFCFFDPIVESDPFSLQIGSGGEAFYWAADAILNDPAGTPVLKLVMAAETAFLQEGPNLEPINGSQFAFMRLRVVFDAPVDGQYVLRHPYGSEYFEVNGATGNRDFVTSYDIGLVPSPNPTVSKVGPFLISASAPAGYAGNVNVVDAVSGSPCGWDFVELTGTNAVTGLPIDFGNGQTALTTFDFAVQGKRYDGVAQTALSADRLTYTRVAGANAGGKVEAFATSSNLASVTLETGPTNGLSAPLVRGVETLGQSVFTPSPLQSTNSAKVATAADAVLPQVLSLTGTAVGSKATKLHVETVDFLDIALADFDPATNTLTVVASSGDAVTPPTLTLREFGDFTAGNPIYTVVTAAPPAVVTVDSSAGGTAKAQVRVTPALAPTAPSGLALSSATARTVTLTWTDTSTNETAFNVYTVDAQGVRALVASTVTNVATVTVSNLEVATAYTFQVDATNNVGSASSETFSASTLALPVAPATVSFLPSTTAQRTLDVTWDDTATDNTGYQVYRRVGTGAFNTIGPVLGGNATSFTDATGLAGATYTYQVVALRGPDSSVATTSDTQTMVGAPTSSAGQPTATISGNTVTVGWGDRSTNERNFQVYRRTGTGPFAAVSGLLAAQAGGSTVAPIPQYATPFADSPVANGTYNYRVDVSNWAGTLQSANSANVVVAVAQLLAPTSVAATRAGSPVVSWIDQSTGETNYRVRRTAQTVNANGSVTAGASTNASSTVAAVAGTGGARTFTDTGVTANATVAYDVAALNGATVGAFSSPLVYTVAGALPTANNPTLVRSLQGAAPNQTARVTVNWALPGNNNTRTSIGGYEIQRCTGTTCTNFATVTGTAVNSAGTVDGRATVTYQDNSVARGTAYRYRMRAVGGAGTGVVGAFSGNVAVTTQ